MTYKQYDPRIKVLVKGKREREFDLRELIELSLR